MEFIQLLSSQISNFILKIGQNIQKSDREKLANFDQNLEKIEKCFDKNFQHVTKLRKVIKDLLTPDEGKWQNWSADDFFKYDFVFSRFENRNCCLFIFIK